MSVPIRKRLLIAIALGLLAGLRTHLIATMVEAPRDFGQVWYAARAVFAGRDPYALIGPGLAFDWPAPFFYPLPAAIAVTPLAPLSATWASTVFMAIGGACFAWALMEHGYPALLGFASSSVVFAAELAQWAPILSAGIVIAPLGAIWIAKPTIGMALFVARPSKWPIIGGGVLCGLAFLLQPHWVESWRTALSMTTSVRGVGFPYIAPAMMPGGIIALVALARWRRPEARLIAALACVPQTLLLYEAVPLFLVPRTLRETELLVFLSYVALGLMPHTGAFAANIDASGRIIVLLLYIPATLMVLRRPNAGPIPSSIEQRIAHWPEWLRGTR